MFKTYSNKHFYPRLILSITQVVFIFTAARFYDAKFTGWFNFTLYAFNLFAIFGGLSLNTGFTFFGAREKKINKLLPSIAVFWTITISLLITFVYFLLHLKAEHHRLYIEIISLASYVIGSLLLSFFGALFNLKEDYQTGIFIMIAINVSATFFFIFNSLVLFLKPEIIFLVYCLVYLLGGLLILMLFSYKYKLKFKLVRIPFRILASLLQFSILNFITNILYLLICRIDYWFVQTYCSETDLGNYTMASKFVQVFLVFGTIVSGFLFNESCKGNLLLVEQLIRTYVKRLSIFFAIVLVGAILFNQKIYTSVLGRSYDQLYYLIIFLIPGVYALSINMLLVSYLNGRKKVAITLRNYFIGLLVMITGDFLIIPKWGIQGAAIVSTVTYFSILMFTLSCFFKNSCTTSIYLPRLHPISLAHRLLSKN
jgi:O-antigen/teichoic acid export membrane protein